MESENVTNVITSNDNVSSCENFNSENVTGLTEDIVEIEIPFELSQFLSTEACDVQELCRICLATNTEVIYSLLPNKDHILGDMFTTLTAIQVKLDDGLPLGVCETCQAQIVSCYDFKMKCEKSNYILKSILKGDFYTKEDIETKESDVQQDETIKLEIKDEDLCQDVQYLEDFNNDSTLYAIQKLANSDKNIDVSVLDSKNLWQEIISERKAPYKHKKQKQKQRYLQKNYTKFKAQYDLIESSIASESQQYACRQCKEKFSSEHDLNVHSSLHTKGSLWKCNKCNKEYKGRSVLRRHIRRHMESKKFTCPTCTKTFAELCALKRHERVHTGEVLEKKYACDYCDKKYSDSRMLSQHIARHAGVLSFHCEKCGKSFLTQRLLASHSRVHTDHKPFVCDYCNKRFRHESTLKTHSRTHTGEKPYICATCGKSFIQNSNLTLHMRTHTGEKPYACTVCGRKFSTGSTLKAHSRTHSTERTRPCLVCGKKYASVSMKNHMRLHNSDRPFECSVCPKKFLAASHLRDHVRVHTGEKPFECALCSQAYTTKSYLINHLKTHENLKRKSKPKMLKLPNDKQTGFIKQKVITDANIGAENIEEVPIEVGGEIIFSSDDNIKTEILVVGNSEVHNRTNNLEMTTTSNEVNIVNSNNLGLVAVGGEEMSISASATSVKLYQLDQSLQIHTTGGQVTISTITSKMTTNF